MISYHLNQSMISSHYGSGFKSIELLDVHRLAKCITNYVWSPCVWEGGKRTQKNFKAARLCVLDFDDGETTLMDAKRIFCDCIHLIGTTRSHQKEKNGLICDRFRVLFIFEKPLDNLRKYRWNMHKFMRNFSCDRACKDGARFFYPCREIVSLATEGYFQKVEDDIPEDFETRRAINQTLFEAGVIPNRIYMKFERNFYKNHRNIAIYGFANDVACYGFTPTEILFKIKESNVFKNFCEDLTDAEILSAINNGINAYYKEVANE